MIWDQLTSTQIASLDKNIPVVLPMAATEQHGPHLPLGTDRMIGEHLAKSLEEQMTDQVLILPPVSVGCSDHHMDFEGTLSLGHDTFTAQVTDLVACVLQHGFSKVIMLNSHGGNQGVGQVLLERLGFAYPEAHFVLATWWKVASKALKDVTETGPGGVGHAGEFETSLMMIIAPKMVNMEAIDNGGNIGTFDWAEGDMLRGSNAAYYRTMEEMTPNGVFGDPTKATEEKGKRITTCVVEALQKIVTDLSGASKS